MMVFTACLGLMERTGRILDGSAFAEKTIALYRTDEIEISIVENRNAEQSITISINNFPMMKLRASFPDADGSFFLTSLEYLAGNTHGWNEFTLQLIGDGRLILGETAILEGINGIEPIQINAARIHRYDTRITGDDALTALRNRHERITALTEWMVTLDGPKAQRMSGFVRYWQPIIFPEVVSRRNKPDNWQQDGDLFQRADDILWNIGYTERIFPEELWEVRNSGTLLRDWEEAVSWIYLKYEWESVVDLLSARVIFTKN
jgi:hypothetical protein